MKFYYSAVDAGSKTKKGVIEAANLREATKLLINQGWYIKRIAPRGWFVSGFKNFSLSRISLVDKVLFVKHLSTMVKSGISLNEALEVIAEQTASKKFKRTITRVLARVRTGQSLGNSLAKFPRSFDPLFVNIIKVGEDSGTLQENLEYLAAELEDRLELKRNIAAASFYPAIVLTSTFVLGFVLAYFVLPKITHLFTSLNFKLPLSTKILIWVADLMNKHGVAIGVCLILVVIILRILISLKFFKPIWHWFLIKLPIIGHIIINYNLVMIARTLAILLKSGLTIDQAIIIAAHTTTNLVYQDKLKKVLPQIQKGKKLSDSLASFKQSRTKPLFPLLVIKMIDIGERSGRLEESLTYLSEYFGKEVEHTTKNLTTVLEPLLLICVGLVVGFIAISIISPIYQITGQLSG